MENQKEKAIKFAQWLTKMLVLNDMGSARDFSRVCQVSEQSLSRFLSPKPTPISHTYQLPKRETLIKIAKGFGVAAEEAFKAAGYFSIETEKFEELEIFLALYVQLNAGQKEKVRNSLSDLQITMQQMLEEDH